MLIRLVLNTRGLQASMKVRLVATSGEALELEPALAMHIPFVRDMAAECGVSFPIYFHPAPIFFLLMPSLQRASLSRSHSPRN